MKWLVIDFGTKKIKLLKLGVEGQRFEIEDFKTLPARSEYYRGLAFPEAPAWAAITIAMNEWDWLPAEEEMMIMASLPSAYCEMRYLKFPFRSDKKIEKVLNFELESQLPFDLEEVQVRHHLLEGAGVNIPRKESLLLAMAYKRSLVKSFEAELKKFQMTSPPMTTQALALSSLRQFIDQVPVYALLQIGHTQSHLLLMQSSGAILGVRTLWWGGRNLIEAIQEEMKVGIEQAEHVLLHLDPEKVPTKNLQVSLRGFVAELRQAFKGFQGWHLQLPKPLPIYTFGRVSHYRSAMSQIEDGLRTDLEAHIVPFPLAKLKSKQIQGLAKIDDLEGALPCLAVALSQTRNHRPRIPSFSETNFQFQQNLKKLRSGSLNVFKRLAILLIVPFLYALVHITVQTRENKKLLMELPRIVSMSGLRFEENLSPEEIAERMRKEVQSNRQKINQSVPAAASPLAAFSQVSSMIPPHLKIDIKELRITASTISFSAETNSNDTAARIVDLLKENFPSVKTGATTSCAGNQKTDCRFFKVEIERQKSS